MTEPRRVVAVVLPLLRIELARASLVATEPDRGPLALVIARPGSTVKDERSLLGNTRLDEVCPEARARGVQPQQTIASARARCAELRVRVVPLGSVREALERVAEALLAYGRTTSFDVDGNVVWVDVTGCAHLHRSEDDGTGERNLVERMHRFIEAMGHSSRVAMADGPLVAAAVARFGGEPRSSVVVPPGENGAALGSLPLAALPLARESRQWLTRLGIKTVNDLQKLPRAALNVRLGDPRGHAKRRETDVKAVMALLEGEDGAPLSPYVPPVVPEETATLEYGIDSTEALLFVVKGLSDRMALRLAGRVMAASRLELTLGLDPAMAREDPRALLDISLAAPLSQASEILAVLRSRIESFTIEAPILSVTLRALSLTPRSATPLQLFVPEAKAERALPRLVAELEAELGPGKVGILTLDNRWIPRERSRLVPIGSPHRSPVQVVLAGPDSPAGALLSGAPEPTRFVSLDGIPSVTGMSARQVRELRVHIRYESSKWWSHDALLLCDYAAAWLDSLQAMAWVEIDRSQRQAWIRGWMD